MCAARVTHCGKREVLQFVTLYSEKSRKNPESLNQRS